MKTSLLHANDTLFYDGGCGLCHRFVRFVLWADGGKGCFTFAPLGGERFRELVPEAEREALPDSIVLHTSGGALLTRSAAVRYVLGRLGAFWRAFGFLMALLPAALLDAVYDGIARRRFRWFARQADWCPAVPAHLRSRFLP